MEGFHSQSKIFFKVKTKPNEYSYGKVDFILREEVELNITYYSYFFSGEFFDFELWMKYSYAHLSLDYLSRNGSLLIDAFISFIF